jgi:hypothetical protein
MSSSIRPRAAAEAVLAEVQNERARAVFGALTDEEIAAILRVLRLDEASASPARTGDRDRAAQGDSGRPGNDRGNENVGRADPRAFGLVQAAYAVDETLEVLSIGRTSLYKLVDAGHLHPVKLGKKTLFLADNLAQFLLRLRQANGVKSVLGQSPNPKAPRVSAA